MVDAKSLAVKLKLDSHHKMERFCVLFIFFVLMFALLFGIAEKKKHDRSKVTLTQQAKYTSSTQWSLTGQSVNVVNVYRNNDSSKVFILLNMDVSTLSTNADDYQIFLTGYNKDSLTNDTMKGAVYIFGNTGYMGLYFYDSRGFDAHMYNIVVRNDNIITSNIGSYGEYSDSSFNYHNQIQLYANFAGTNAVVADFLNSDNPSLTDIYADLVTASSESSIRSSLRSTLVSMNEQMLLINYYADSLRRYDVVVPSLPAALAGDVITSDSTLSINNPEGFDKSMTNTNSSVISSNYNSIDVGSDVFDCIAATDVNNTGTLYLVTDFVFPGGYQYDWQNMKITDNIIGSLKPESMTFTEWTSSKTNEKSVYSTVSSSLDRSYYSTWYKADGSVISYSSDSSMIDESTVSGIMTNYVNAVSSLYSLKYKYQTEQLYSLLNLEYVSESSAAIFSINNSDNVLVMY